MRLVLLPFLGLLGVFSSRALAVSDWLAAPQPPYPVISALHKTSGTVTLRLVLQEDGRVKKATIERESGSDRLDAAARMGVLQWRLNPARLRAADLGTGRLVEIEFKKTESDPKMAQAVLLRAGQHGSAWEHGGTIRLPGSARFHHRKPGSVLLQFTIGFDRHPRLMKILVSSGYPPYDQAAIDGIESWKAFPQFVGESFKVPVTFSL